MKQFNSRLLPAGLAAAAILWLMVWHGAWLQTVSTPLGIIHLELADTTERLAAINTAWYSLRYHATWNIIWDFFFLCAYSSFFLPWSACSLQALALAPAPWYGLGLGSTAGLFARHHRCF
jgi:hypothetical protein